MITMGNLNENGAKFFGMGASKSGGSNGALLVFRGKLTSGNAIDTWQIPNPTRTEVLEACRLAKETNNPVPFALEYEIETFEGDYYIVPCAAYLVDDEDWVSVEFIVRGKRAESLIYVTLEYNDDENISTNNAVIYKKS